MSRSIQIRYACADDAQALLAMMWSLAEFEGYAHAFQIDLQQLLQRGLVDGAARQFTAIVAEDADGSLLAYAVICQLDYTYDLRACLILKELFVQPGARGRGIASELMRFVIGHAKQCGAGRLKWDVLPDNFAAQAFYQRFGAQPVSDWQAWRLDLPA